VCRTGAPSNVTVACSDLATFTLTSLGMLWGTSPFNVSRFCLRACTLAMESSMFEVWHGGNEHVFLSRCCCAKEVHVCLHCQDLSASSLIKKTSFSFLLFCQSLCGSPLQQFACLAWSDCLRLPFSMTTTLLFHLRRYGLLFG